MKLKSDKSIREYLKTLPDDTIIKYYLDVEFTPFPVLIIEEYQRRFKRKTKEEILRKLRFQANLAKKKSRELRSMAKQQKLLVDVTKQKSEEIINQAKKRGLEISNILAKKGMGTSMRKAMKAVGMVYSSKDDLRLLEELANLRKAGIITEKEFKAKKKKILERI